jgi:Ca-activated chloride channel family protein
VFLSVLGVGTDRLRDHTMEQLADKGNGNYAYLDGIAEARKVLLEEAGATLVTIAKDVKIQVEFDPDQVEQHRLIGYENRVLAHRDFADDTKDAGEMGAGHTVTALFEVVLAERARSDEPLMALDMRYKAPTGSESRKLSVPVVDRGAELDETSDDYRFSAAVAAFGQKLRRSEYQRNADYGAILDLARSALGSDPHCYRHQFLELVWTAGVLAGERLEQPDTTCTRDARGPQPRIYEGRAMFDIHLMRTDQDWLAFVLQGLRLLPPLLALPFFVLAFRGPRRRRLAQRSRE